MLESRYAAKNYDKITSWDTKEPWACCPSQPFAGCYSLFKQRSTQTAQDSTNANDIERQGSSAPPAESEGFCDTVEPPTGDTQPTIQQAIAISESNLNLNEKSNLPKATLAIL